jgi:hypothetical protein
MPDLDLYSESLEPDPAKEQEEWSINLQIRILIRNPEYKYRIINITSSVEHKGNGNGGCCMCEGK